MTKEEILDNEYNSQEIRKGILSTFPVPFPTQLKNVVIVAMDEYAKQQAIAFGFHVLGADPKDPEMGGVDEMGKTYDQFIIESQNKHV